MLLRPKDALHAISWSVTASRNHPALETESGEVGLVVEAGVGIFDLRLGLLQLSLAQLHDGADAEVVACLREIERGVGLIQQLRGDGHALLRRLHGEPCGANVAD